MRSWRDHVTPGSVEDLALQLLDNLWLVVARGPDIPEAALSMLRDALGLHGRASQNDIFEAIEAAKDKIRENLR